MGLLNCFQILHLLAFFFLKEFKQIVSLAFCIKIERINTFIFGSGYFSLYLFVCMCT